MFRFAFINVLELERIHGREGRGAVYPIGSTSPRYATNYIISVVNYGVNARAHLPNCMASRYVVNLQHTFYVFSFHARAQNTRYNLRSFRVL